MASRETLSVDLQCPICKELLKAPKLLGDCLHSACLGCLENLAAANSSNSFQCPLCRQNCTIPPKGVVELRNDFRMQAIAEKYQKMKNDKAFIHCTACSNPAIRYCEECDKIYLCKPCSEKHSQDPLTAAHELAGICSKHGKKLALYCKKCHTAICNVCLIADHPSGNETHDVVSHQDVAGDEAAEVAAAVEKLDKVREEKENALLNIITVRESMVETINSDLVKLTRQSDSAIEHVRLKKADLTMKHENIENQIANLREQVEGILKQIDAMVKKRTALEKEISQTNKKETTLRHLKEDYSEYLNQYLESCHNKFQEVVIKAVAETDEIKARLDRGRRETSLDRILDDQTVPSLYKVKEELTQSITAAEQVGGADPVFDAKENMVRFLPSSAKMEIGHFVKREFATLAKFSDMSFPSKRPTDMTEGLNYVRLLTNGHLASLYRSKNYPIDMADTISLHYMASPAYPDMMIGENIYPAVDMTVTLKGELMVLRTAEPAVRVFNSHSSGFRDINISIGEPEIRWVRSIETDKEGNIFVGDKFGHVRAFDPDGALIEEVKASFTNILRMSYDHLTRTLYITNGQNMILRYHWDGTTFKTMSSFADDMYGFSSSDVCIHNDEVYVAGKMNSTGEVMVFQVVKTKQMTDQKELSEKKDDTSELKMIMLTFDDNDDRKKAGVWLPKISVFGNTLALGLKDNVELFHLKP